MREAAIHSTIHGNFVSGEIEAALKGLLGSPETRLLAAWALAHLRSNDPAIPPVPAAARFSLHRPP